MVDAEHSHTSIYKYVITSNLGKHLVPSCQNPIAALKLPKREREVMFGL
jgi:hypothetical protein